MQMNRMARWRRGCGLLVISWLVAGHALAQDTIWTNTVASANFTNAPSWSAGVPGTASGINDNAVFTNSRSQTISFTSVPSCANAAFQAQTGTVALSIGTAWLVTNRVVQSPVAGTTNTISQTGTGVLAVTNPAGTAQMTVGLNGVASYNGRLLADSVVVGSNTGAAGTLTLTNGSALGALTVAGSPGSSGTVTINPGSVSLGSLTLGAAPGSASGLNWLGSLSVGGVSDPSAVLGSLVGSSFGKDRGQTLSVTTNAVSAALTNALILGETATGTGIVNWAGGVLAITNASGSSSLTVGQNGYGLLRITSGTVTVDRIYATNTSLAAQSSILSNAPNGVLNTLNGSVITVPTNTGAVTANSGLSLMGGTWNMLGGTNIVQSGTGSGQVYIVAGARVVVSGPGTVWSNALNGSAVNSQMVQLNGTLVVSNGAQVIVPATLGRFRSYSASLLNVTGSNSLFRADHLSEFVIGDISTFSTCLVSKGATLITPMCRTIGLNISHHCTAIVSESAVWTNLGYLEVGYTGATGTGYSNTLTIASGGSVYDTDGTIGDAGASNCSESNDAVYVTGPGSRWVNTGNLTLGFRGAAATNNVSINHALMIAAGGTVSVASNLFIGTVPGTYSNQVTVGDATSVLAVTNRFGTGLINVSNGTLCLSGGTVIADRLRAVNGASGTVVFAAGTLVARSVTNLTGTAFTVGDGAQAGILQLMGGTSSFGNGLTIASNSTLSGTGTVVGAVTVYGGGCVSPAGPGTTGLLTINGSLELQSGAVLEADVAASATDRVVVVGTATLPAAATIKATLPGGYNSRQPAVLLSATTLAGTTDLSGWSVANHPELVPSIQNGTSVVLGARLFKQTVLLFR